MSGSMDASDWDSSTPLPDKLTPGLVPPSRITVAKQQIRQLLADVPNSRAALLGFASNTVLVSPLADSPKVLLQRLEMIKTEHFADGTTIGQGIRAAVNALKYAPDDGPRAIILLSDGVDHTETDAVRPEQAAAEAAAEGIVIFAVGIGGRVALHPVNDDNGIQWKAVGEPLDINQLAAVAEATRGRVYTANDSSELVQAIASIGQQLRLKNSTFTARRTVTLAPWLLLAAMLSALCASTISFFRPRRAAT